MNDYPVAFSVDYPDRPLNRLSTCLRLFLVIPIAGYLIWDRRGTLRGLAASPMPIVSLLALPLAVAWLAAERLGIMEGRQLVAISMVEVLFLAMFGWRLWYAMLGPLLSACCAT